MLRTLLALLLARPNRPVPVDVLVDALWGGDLGRAGQSRLQLLVHNLRRALGDHSRIRFEYGGYALRVEAGELDADRFETLLNQSRSSATAGDATRMVEPLRQALELWQGEPFEGAGDVGPLRGEVERLSDRRLGAYEDLYEAELASGHATEVTAELVERAGRHPFRERLQALAMRALYQAGRQADALAVYQRARETLVEELGLDPGPELRRLEQAILAGDDLGIPTPGVPAPKPAQLPADIGDFTGRAAQVRLLVEQLAPPSRADRSGSPEAVVIAATAGPAGVGKTTLAVHAAHRMRSCYPDGQLYVNLRGAEREALDPGEALARLLRAVGVESSAVPEELDERACLYRSVLAERRVLVLLDNAASVGQVRPLLPGTATCGVLVTSRTRLAGLEGARSLELGLFAVDQAVELLARIAGKNRVGAEPAAAAEIARLCGYLPLAVRIAGARLDARPHWSLARLAELLADEHGRLDELRLSDLEVRASLALSHQGLGTTPQRLLRGLGLLEASDFPSWVAAAVLDAPLSAAERALEELVDARLLEVVRPEAAGGPRYLFHDLVRVYARERAQAEDAEPHRTAVLERVVGGWLGLASKAGARLGEMESPIRPGVSRWTLDPATTDMVLGDPQAWLQAEQTSLAAAVEQAATTPAMHGLAWELGSALRWRTMYDFETHPWRRMLELTLLAVRRAGDRRGEGATLQHLGQLHYRVDRYHDAAACYQQAVAVFRTLDEAPSLARALFSLGETELVIGRADDAHRSVDEALAVSLELGDRPLEALTRCVLAEIHLQEGRADEAVASFEQAGVVFEATGCGRKQTRLLLRLGVLHHGEGRVAEAEAYLQRCLARADDLGPREMAYVSHELGALYVHQRKEAEAQVLLPRCLRVARDTGDRHLEALALHSLGELHRNRSRFDEAVVFVDLALQIWRDVGLPLWRARALRTLGDVQEAAGDSDAAEAAWREAVETFAELCSPEADDLAARLARPRRRRAQGTVSASARP